MKKIFTIIALLTASASAYAQVPAVTGDVDGDGFVTSTDVTALYNWLLMEDDTFLATSDVDGDGEVTSADITMVYNIILGITPSVSHEYVDLGLPSGTLWATTNVGASTPEECGDYFAWGETTSKDYYGWDNYAWSNGNWNKLTKYCNKSNYGDNGFVDNLTELEPEDDAATANWGSEWCMPSRDQFSELIAQCTMQWTTSNGVNGYKVTSKINGATMFLPAAGFYFSGTLYSVGNIAYYWTRDVYSARCYYAYYFFFHSSGSQDLTNGDRDSGFSVRPVRKSPN